MLQRGMRGNDCNTVLCYKQLTTEVLQKAGYKVTRHTSWVKLSEALRNFAPGCDEPDPLRPQQAICEADRYIIDCMSGQAKQTCREEFIHLHALWIIIMSKTNDDYEDEAFDVIFELF